MLPEPTVLPYDGAFVPRPRGYGRVLAANAVSNLGDGMLLAAAPLLAVELTDDPRLVAGVTTAAMLPWLLVALVSGVVVDRLDRRVLRAVVDALRAAALAVFALAVAIDVVELWMLFAVVLLVGVGETIADNAAQAMLPMIVTPDRLRSANSQMEASTLIADRLIGPPLGGVAFVAVAWLPFTADAASFAIAAVLVASLRGRFRAEPSAGAAARHGEGGAARLRREVAEGFTALVRHPVLGSMAVIIAVWNMADAMMTAVLVLLAADRLGLEGAGYGVLLAAFALGGLLGSVSAARLLHRVGDGTAMQLAVFLSVPVALALALSANPVVAGVALALAGWLGVTWNVAGASLRQELVPGRLLGRVTSAYWLFSLGALPIGALVGGFVARVDIRAPYFLAAALSLAAFLYALPRLANARIAEARAATQGTR